MDRLVVRQNIARFRLLLTTATDGVRRPALLRLLAGHEAQWARARLSDDNPRG